MLAAALGSILATGTGQMALDAVLGITLPITQVQHLPYAGSGWQLCRGAASGLCAGAYLRLAVRAAVQGCPGLASSGAADDLGVPIICCTMPSIVYSAAPE